MPASRQKIVGAFTVICLAAMAAAFYRAGGCSGGLVPYDRPPRRSTGFRIDLDTASRAELLQLPGVGPRTADRILEERTRRGGFRSIEELGDVPGIGDVTLERLREYLTVPPRRSSDAGTETDVRTREPLPAGR
jgi:competence ComEA-like helix-hairpin-helix protein